jgi:spore coat protein U-like protein
MGTCKLYFGAAAMLLLAAPAAEAATATGNMNVTVTIQETCTITSIGTLDFGSQQLLNANVDAQATIQVQCTNGTDYDVSLDNGQNATRRMKQGTEFVDYELYSNSGRSVIWPTTASPTTPYANTGTGAAQSIQVYGRIPPQTTPAAGTYNDVVAVTVTY